MTLSKLVVVSGTNRPQSNTRKVAGQLLKIYRSIGVEAQLLDLVDLPSKLFLPTSYAEKPSSFLPFSKLVLESDGLHLVTPEYNGGIPGVLKYFIDMLPFPESLERRPVCFVGLAAGMWGALRPVEQLQAIFGYRNAFIFPERIFVPRVNEMFGVDENLEPESSKRLEHQARGFVDYVNAVEGLRPAM